MRGERPPVSGSGYPPSGTLLASSPPKRHRNCSFLGPAVAVKLPPSRLPGADYLRLSILAHCFPRAQCSSAPDTDQNSAGPVVQAEPGRCVPTGDKADLVD